MNAWPSIYNFSSQLIITNCSNPMGKFFLKYWWWLENLVICARFGFLTVSFIFETTFPFAFCSLFFQLMDFIYFYLIVFMFLTSYPFVIMLYTLPNYAFVSMYWLKLLIHISQFINNGCIFVLKLMFTHKICMNKFLITKINSKYMCSLMLKFINKKNIYKFRIIFKISFKTMYFES